MAVAQKTDTQNGTLVSGNMDQNLRNPSCLILSHTQMFQFLGFMCFPGLFFFFIDLKSGRCLFCCCLNLGNAVWPGDPELPCVASQKRRGRPNFPRRGFFCKAVNLCLDQCSPA